MGENGFPLSLPSSQEACAVIGQEFRVRGGSEDHGVLLLEEVKAERSRAASTAWRMPYSMFLRGPSGESLPQGIYTLFHPAFGPLCLYLVPRSRELRTGAVRYEAVFD
ncbi:hypothetical protein ABS767_06435 [Sphingomonas sp. ST-64]|uniref:DUF6916 domain-containing protein n=1 Tax=Sphingomonas plantiphila TaxID=3163295 RepID=A0ABW8YKY4_9SPHN